MAELEFLPRYNHIRDIRGGNINQVSLVNDRETGAAAVVKTSLWSSLDDPSLPYTLENEAEVLASVDHPQIPSLLEANFSWDRAYIVLEAMRGNSYIPHWLVKFPAPKFAARLILSALDPLEHLHDKEMTHNDIKTMNLVMQWCGTTALIDFELAGKKVKSGGTSAYMSPERIREQATTPESDIYSMGITFYELLYGHRPYNGPRERIRENHLYRDIDFKAPSGRNIPKPLVEVVQTATEKDPDNRYRSAHEMRVQIAHYLMVEGGL